jgi:arsenate reductase
MLLMRTLFVCTGNTCRSPLAERLARQLYPEHHWESAGVIPALGIHPMSARVLRERGADAARFRSRYAGSLNLPSYDHIVLIGETARDMLPPVPEPTQTHYWKIPDPFGAVGSPERVLNIYRGCADLITEHIDRFVSEHAPADGGS